MIRYHAPSAEVPQDGACNIETPYVIGMTAPTKKPAIVNPGNMENILHL